MMCIEGFRIYGLTGRNTVLVFINSDIPFHARAICLVLMETYGHPTHHKTKNNNISFGLKMYPMKTSSFLTWTSHNFSLWNDIATELAARPYWASNTSRNTRAAQNERAWAREHTNPGIKRRHVVRKHNSLDFQSEQKGQFGKFTTYTFIYSSLLRYKAQIR